jgi:hypothetical protein
MPNHVDLWIDPTTRLPERVDTPDLNDAWFTPEHHAGR